MFFLLLIPIVLLSHVGECGNMTNGLRLLLKREKTTNILITFKEDSSTFLNSITLVRFKNREARLNAVVHALQERAVASQRKVLRLLNRARLTNIDYQILWISNQLIVRGADINLVKELAKFKNVGEISEETFIEIENLSQQKVTNQSFLSRTITWGVNKIQAPSVWESGRKGGNVIVGVVDTGVRATHEAIQGNYVGKSNYGWYDPGKKSESPTDDNGHGTHCTGTIVGTNGIGVAPEAKWMACKGCETNSCSNLHLLECLQFMTCPTDTNGENPDCSKAPHIVSNSWGSRRNLEFSRATTALRDAGIIVLFAAGNRGREGCSSVDSPGDYDTVIAVGATTDRDEVSSFSATGPTVDRKIKPDIVAPGSRIESASNQSDDGYATLDGTSMACPHAAGVVALMLSKSPGLTPSEVRSILNKSTDTVRNTWRFCGGASETRYPNNRAGYGRINAKKAVDNA